MSDNGKSVTYPDRTSPRFDLNPEQSISPQRLVNVDQLPVYGPAAAGGAISATDLIPLVAREIEHEQNKQMLVYIHVPFCAYKCSFCDWVADLPTPLLTSGADVRQTYVDALCRQIRHLGPKLMELGYAPRYIYWGGGTPSRLEGDQFRQIMQSLNAVLDLSKVEEHVMEVTPDSLNAAKLEAIKEVGVSRISMGVQSFSETELRRSGRGHSPEDADRAVEMMRAAGFDNFNLDLIVAFPDQKLDVLQRSLERTVEHRPKHVTAYLYRPTPATTMAKRRKQASTVAEVADHTRACYQLTLDVLKSAGYHEYTLGYFTRQLNDRCGGEMYYFHLQGDWVGFGGGAVSILGHHRLKNSHANLHRFIDDPFVFDACERLQDRQVEAAIYTLRQSLVTDIGVDYANFERFFGFPFSSVRQHPAIKAYIGYYKYCGAIFRESDRSLSITPETRGPAYIKVWSKAGMPMRTAAALKREALTHREL
jgi:coproporphyrinogen III oxidase-like Fe-S oxidoreductase